MFRLGSPLSYLLTSPRTGSGRTPYYQFWRVDKTRTTPYPQPASSGNFILNIKKKSRPYPTDRKMSTSVAIILTWSPNSMFISHTPMLLRMSVRWIFGIFSASSSKPVIGLNPNPDPNPKVRGRTSKHSDCTRHPTRVAGRHRANGDQIGQSWRLVSSAFIHARIVTASTVCTNGPEDIPRHRGDAATASCLTVGDYVSGMWFSRLAVARSTDLANPKLTITMVEPALRFSGCRSLRG